MLRNYRDRRAAAPRVYAFSACDRAGGRMGPRGYSLETLERFVGTELGVSDWFEMGQDRIQAFADCTGDHQWIHVDGERARRESIDGTTIAHGYLTLSMLPNFIRSVGLRPDGVFQSYNYGADRIR